MSMPVNREIKKVKSSNLEESADFVNSVLEKNYVQSEKLFENMIRTVVKQKLDEKKKMIAASTFCESKNIDEGKRLQALGQAIKNAGNPAVPFAINAALGGIVGGKHGAIGTTGLTAALHANEIRKDYKRIRNNQEYDAYMANSKKKKQVSEASAIEAAKEAEEKVKAAAEKHVKDRPKAKAELDAARAADASHPSGKTFDKWEKDRAKRRKKLGISEAKKLSPKEKEKAQNKIWNEIHSDHPDSDPKIEDTLARIHAARAKQMKEEDTHDVSEGVMKIIKRAVTGQRGKLVKKIAAEFDKVEKQNPDNLTSKLKRLQRMSSLTHRTLRAGGVASPRKNPKGLAEANESHKSSSGFLDVEHKKSHVLITYSGNMGARESDVQNAFDKLHGQNGAFAKIRPHGTIHKGHDDPSYSYALKVPKKIFNDKLGITDLADHYRKLNSTSNDDMKSKISNYIRDKKNYEKK